MLRRTLPPWISPCLREAAAVTAGFAAVVGRLAPNSRSPGRQRASLRVVPNSRGLQCQRVLLRAVQVQVALCVVHVLLHAGPVQVIPQMPVQVIPQMPVQLQVARVVHVPLRAVSVQVVL
jgi:hypothetical protein